MSMLMRQEQDYGHEFIYSIQDVEFYISLFENVSHESYPFGRNIKIWREGVKFFQNIGATVTAKQVYGFRCASFKNLGGAFGLTFHHQIYRNKFGKDVPFYAMLSDLDQLIFGIFHEEEPFELNPISKHALIEYVHEYLSPFTDHKYQTVEEMEDAQ